MMNSKKYETHVMVTSSMLLWCHMNCVFYFLLTNDTNGLLSLDIKNLVC